MDFNKRMRRYGLCLLSCLLMLLPCRAAKATQDFYDLNLLEAGTIIDGAQLDTTDLSKYFISSKISPEVYERIKGKSFDENGKIKKSDLRYIKVLHYNYSHQIQVGELIVNKSIAKDICEIFQELFAHEYEIKSMYLIEQYWATTPSATDNRSCNAGNTSAFFYRTMTGNKEKLSKHAKGLAIDINPIENPYVYKKNGKWTCTLKNARKYVDRSKKRKHAIGHKDYCYKVFTAHGFDWGGDWNSIKDYQHFEK